MKMHCTQTVAEMRDIYNRFLESDTKHADIPDEVTRDVSDAMRLLSACMT